MSLYAFEEFTSDEEAILRRYFTNLDLAGEPVYQTVTRSSEQMWLGEVAPGVQPRQFSASMTGLLVASQARSLGASLLTRRGQASSRRLRFDPSTPRSPLGVHMVVHSLCSEPDGAGRSTRRCSVVWC